MRRFPKVQVGYLEVLVLAVVASAYLQYLWQYALPQIPLLFGQSPGIWSGGLLMGVALLVWIFHPWHRAGPLQFTFTLGFLSLLWVWQMAITFLHQDAFTYGVWLYPIVIAMLLLKAPSRSESQRALLFLGWVLVILIVGTRALEITHVIATAETSPSLVRFEMENYWLPLSGWLGPEGRWVGPFFHNSQTGNVGAYLVVLGVALRKRSSAVFILVGVTTVLLTGSRTSMVAATIGVAVAFLLGPYPWNQRVRLRNRLLGIGVISTLAVLTAFVYSPSLTGRDVYWSHYWGLWRSSPWVGVGISGRNSGPEEFFQVNGHNLVIDALGIYGLLAAACVLLVLLSALVLGIRSTLSGETTALSMVVTYVVIGMTQSDYNWTVTSLPWLVLMLSLLLASATIQEAVRAARNPREAPDDNQPRSPEGGGTIHTRRL